MTTLIHEKQRWTLGILTIFFSLTVLQLMISNNGVSADYYNGDMSDVYYLDQLNGMQPQKRDYDVGYGELISIPREISKRGGNDAINRIISRLRPTYAKRPRERRILRFSSKRGIDFGLARGFSGSQALKHALGLAAAKYSGGPGRKKRTDPATGPIVI